MSLIRTVDAYLQWLRSTWRASSWEHLPGYSRSEVRARCGRYLKLEKAGPGLGPSFEAYHDQLLEPWIGSRFFDPGPRIGIYLREFPLPCLDNTRGLLSGHEGRAPLPSTVMRESVEAVLDGNRAYQTVAGALEGAQAILHRLFNQEFGSLQQMLDHAVFTDWVRPFAMFSGDRGQEFTEKLSKRSCHTRQMYAFAGECLAEEVKCLDLDFLIVMGLGHFDQAWKHMDEGPVWPEPKAGKFQTLKQPPPQGFFQKPGLKTIVLPHPATTFFNKALVRLGAQPSSRSFKDQTLEDLTSVLLDLLGDAEVRDLERSRYRRVSWEGRSVHLQQEGSGWTLKTKNKAPEKTRGEWKVRSEKSHPACVEIPAGTPRQAMQELVLDLFQSEVFREKL